MMADKISGIADLSQAFKSLNVDIQNKIAPRMVAAGGGVFKRAAKTLAISQGLRKSGAYINNIVLKREKNTPAGVIEYHGGVRHGNALGNGKKIIKYLVVSKGRIVTKRKNDPFYWRFLEFGTKDIAAHHNLQDAFEQNQTPMLAAMEKVAQKEILKGKS